jgi:succinate dehydrogenase / fumarate reductase flavoprotein subunit
VHGANRLGTNSLLDINVFGRRAGIAAAEYAKDADWPTLPDRPEGTVVDMLERLRKSTGNEKVAQIRKEMQETMDLNAQVYRNEATLTKALDDVRALRERYAHVTIMDKGQRYNTDLLEAVELGFLLDLAEALAYTALERRETRGGHAREDYPERDDKNFMAHSMLYRKSDGSLRLEQKPVTITRYQPMERKY